MLGHFQAMTTLALEHGWSGGTVLVSCVPLARRLAFLGGERGPEAGQPIPLTERVAISCAKAHLFRAFNRIGTARQECGWAQLEQHQLPARLVRSIHEIAAQLSRDIEDHPAALRHQLAVLELSRAAGGRADRLLIVALQSAADAAIDTGEPELSRQLIDEAVSLAESVFGSESQLHLTALINLAMATGTLGDQASALSLATEAYQLDRARYGEDHPETVKDKRALDSLRGFRRNEC